MPKFHNLNIMTLNCWLLPSPWPLGSKHKAFRIEKLIEGLSLSNFDVVALQEIWTERIYLEIVQNLKEKFPYSHYFHSGFTGSGTCVISRHRIVSTLMHRYSLNGFPHHIHRGDWFGGKIVGMVEIQLDQFKMSFYTTHLHAEYNRENDLFLPHRISQCFEMSQFIKHTSKGSDFVILVGDFNMEPNDLGCHLIKNMAQLHDGEFSAIFNFSPTFRITSAWECRPNSVEYTLDTGMTCDRPDNCYTRKYSLKESHDGKRLDYIMYRSEKIEIELLSCHNCFNKIPDSEINYSDHLGVAATFAIKRETFPETISEQMRQIVTEKQILTKSLKIIENGEIRVLWDRRLFMALSVVLIALVAATANIDRTLPFVYYVVTLIRFLLTLFVGFCIWYGFIGLTIELKALKETKFSLKKILRCL